jgi:ferricrocin synthase
MTYRETNSRVTELAIELEKIPRTINWPAVRGNQRVFPLFISPCPELYISILAVLKAGHTFCPLPIDAPQERLKDILEDLGSPVVLGVGSERFQCAGSSVKTEGYDKLKKIVWLDVSSVKRWSEKDTALSSKSEAATGVSQPQELSGDDLAYIYYTSGSTGRPKGVQISHLAATCAISSNAAVMPILSKEAPLRWFQLAAPTFDAFILDVFLTLSAGGTLCVADREITLTDVEGAINELEANTTNSVPSLAMMFRPERMPKLKTLLCIGEQLNRKVVETFSFDSHLMSKHNTSSGCPEGLTNLYGPTEATINVTTERFTSKTRGSIIGKVLPSCSIILLDLQSKALKPVPLGVPGHLAIGGPQVSHGYLNRPEENARQYVSSPEFGRLYLTGDKARIVWNEKGEQRLECMGRIQDGQVKLNGRRVELEEIDSVLTKAKFISDVATVTLEASGGTQLVACAVLSFGFASSNAELTSLERQAESACRKAAETYLPRWMYPHHFVFLQSLARTASGKIDRKSIAKAAKEIAIHRADTGSTKTSQISEDAPPKSAIEKILPAPTDAELPNVLCHLLMKVLASNSQDITPTTSLFALGLDSLRAIAFLQEARDQSIYELGIQDMLKGLTPKELAKAIVNRRRLKMKAASTSNGNQGSKAIGGEDTNSTISPSIRLQTLLSDFDNRYRSSCAEQLGIPSERIESVYPTTYIQTRMIATFLDADSSSNPIVRNRKPWIEHFVYNVPESIDSHRFQESFRTVIKRHDCFRTVFTLVQDPVTPCAQCILSPSCPEATIPWSNIYCDSFDTRQNSLFERSVENAQRTADEQMRLERPPAAVSSIRSGSGKRCVLVLSLFHGIYDGASLKLFREEVMAEYYSQQPPPRTSLATAVRLHFSPDPKTTLKFWIGKLAVAPYYKLTGVPTLPSDTTHDHSIKNGLSINGDAGNSLAYSIPESPVSVVTMESKATYADLIKSSTLDLLTTPLSIVQAAWALVLLECQHKTDASRTSDDGTSYDVTFGSTIHSRHNLESQVCMGPILTTIPVLIAGDISSDGAETNREMCHILAHEHAEALEHLQIQCPSLEFARTLGRFDTTLILQAFGDETSQKSLGSTKNGIEDAVDFPSFENGDNWTAAYRGSDFCMPVLIEVMPGLGRTMKFMCTFQNQSPKYPWLMDSSARQLLDLFEANLSWIMANPDETFDPEKRTKTEL